MVDLETIQEGVMVYPGAMPPIFKQELEAVVRESGEEISPEDAFILTMDRVAELATRTLKPEQIVA